MRLIKINFFYLFMGGICEGNRGYPIIESNTFECILPTEIKPYEMKSNLVEV